MSKPSDFFDRHMKTRNALQLVLDGLPLFCLIGMYFGIDAFWDTEENLLSTLVGFLVIPSGIGFVLSIPIMILAARFRQLANPDFECYPICKVPSAILRWLSLIPAVFSIPMIFGFISVTF